ncbi:conserved hypothetical protein [Roseibium sp. TrichSKD4]|nr:conserved hypothetical protein [Roseibium sp. TrichSKD4]
MTKFQTSVLICFFLLIFICAGLMVASEFLGASNGEKVLEVASQGFTFSLGSAVGALIAMTGRFFE